MSFDLLVRNGTVVFPDRAPARLDVAVRDGRFAALLEPGRPHRRLGPARHAELGEQVRHVVLHRLLRQEQLVGDLAVRAPLGEEMQDLALLLGERAESLVLGRALTDPAQQRGGHGRVEQGLARRDPPHGVDEVGAPHLLEQVPRRAGDDR